MAASNEVDLELIAAFIDGRLTGAERDRAMKLLGESEEAFEIYSDALRTRADLRDSGVIPITDGQRPRVSRWRVAVPFAAAALLMIAVLPTLQARRNRAAYDASVESIAGPLLATGTNVSTALGPSWEQRDWAVYRGGATLVDSTTAFRLGVRATDTYVALRAGDGERTSRLVGEMMDLLRSVTASESVRASYGEVRDSLATGRITPELVAQVTGAEDDLRGLLNSPWFSAGRWIAAGELAARARSTAFFSSASTGRFLDWAIDHGSLAPGDVELLRQVQVLTGQGVTGEDFETIRQKLAELIRRNGG